MEDFYKLLNKYRIDGTFCDVALWAKCPTNPENVMGPYSAHKVVLAATCPSLAAVMTSQNIALDAADSETMPVLLSWVYGQREQAAKSIVSDEILQRVKYLAKCLGMKSFMTFLTTVSINNGTPPTDILKPEVHPILEKRSNTNAKPKPEAAPPPPTPLPQPPPPTPPLTTTTTTTKNEDDVERSAADATTVPAKGNATPPHAGRISIGRPKIATTGAKPEIPPVAPQKENLSDNVTTKLSTSDEKDQVLSLKETTPASDQQPSKGEDSDDAMEGSAEEGSSQEADSTTEDNTTEPMNRRKRGQKEEQLVVSPAKRKREVSEDNNNQLPSEENRSTPLMRSRVENKLSGNKMASNLKMAVLPDKISKPVAKPSPKPTPTPKPTPKPSSSIAPSSALSTQLTSPSVGQHAGGKTSAYGWSASWGNVDMNKLKIPEDTTKYPYKKVKEATVAMTCYCHICGKMKSGKELKSHYEKIHTIDVKDSYQVICLVEKAEDFLQKCKWVALKDLTKEMSLDLVCGVCYVNKSGKRILFKHLKEKHDVDVNEQNPNLELLVEKKMWEIDMESVSELGAETGNDVQTSWIKYCEAAPTGQYQCHECERHINSKKALKHHLISVHSKEIDEKDGSVLQIQIQGRGGPGRKRRSTMGVRDIL